MSADHPNKKSPDDMPYSGPTPEDPAVCPECDMRVGIVIECPCCGDEFFRCADGCGVCWEVPT